VASSCSFYTATAVSDCPTADLTGDCIVDISDLLLFSENWLSSDLPQHPGLVAHWALNESTAKLLPIQ
jgi:hypothetical protein